MKNTIKKTLSIAALSGCITVLISALCVQAAKAGEDNNYYYYAYCGSKDHGTKGWHGAGHWGTSGSTAEKTAKDEVENHKSQNPKHPCYLAHSKKMPD